MPQHRPAPRPACAETGTILGEIVAAARYCSISGSSSRLVLQQVDLVEHQHAPASAAFRTRSSACAVLLARTARVASARNSSRSRSSSAARTVSIMRLLMRRVGLVDARACPRRRPAPPASVSTPWMDVRVVCGLSATMATFVPTSAFSSVDLPAFGRPRMETNPDRNPALAARSLHSCATVCDFADPHLLHAQLVAGQHFDADAVAFHRLRPAAARGRAIPSPARRRWWTRSPRRAGNSNRSSSRARSKLPETM